MKAFIDYLFMQKILTDETGDTLLKFLDTCVNAGVLAPNDQPQIIFGWPSLLEYLGLESLLENVPRLDNTHPLFSFIASALNTNVEKEIMMRLYDQIFVEYLTQIKALPQVHPTILLHKIREKRQWVSSPLEERIFSLALNHYEKYLSQHPYDAIHDLTLYLAWDRVCVNLAAVFEYGSSNLDISYGLETFKECLIESFQHITAQGRASPSFFRLMEALYAYQMRDENLDRYPDAEWLILCQGAHALRPREHLANAFYIDAAVVHEDLKKEESLKGFMMEPADHIQSGLSLAHYMMQTLKAEVPGWHYALRPIEIFCLKQNETGFYIDRTISSLL